MIKLNGHEVEFGRFPNGEIYLDIEKHKKYLHLTYEEKVEWTYKNNEDI